MDQFKKAMITLCPDSAAQLRTQTVVGSQNVLYVVRLSFNTLPSAVTPVIMYNMVMLYLCLAENNQVLT